MSFKKGVLKALLGAVIVGGSAGTYMYLQEPNESLKSEFMTTRNMSAKEADKIMRIGNATIGATAGGIVGLVAGPFLPVRLRRKSDNNSGPTPS